MKAVCWYAKHDVRVVNVPEPKILNPRDAILRVTSTAICGGTVSIPGVYGGFLDKMPFGAAFGKGLKMAMGQTHVHRYMQPLLERIAGDGDGRFDPTYIITHRIPLSDAPQAYKIFNEQKNECVKVVLQP